MERREAERGTLFIFVATLAATAAGAIAPDRALAQEIPAYAIELGLHPSEGRVTGRATVRLPASSLVGGEARLNLSGSGGGSMEVGEVVGASGRSLPWDAADGRLTVRLDEAEPGATVTVAYTFPIDPSWLEPFGYYVFARFGPGSWAYPLLLENGETPYVFGDYEVTLDHPSALTVLTTGGAGEVERSGGRTVARYTAEHVTGFAIVAGEGFTVERSTSGSVPVVAFYHPDHADRFAKVMEAVGEAAAWYRRTYGFFPLEEVGIIQGHPRWGGGFPLPNLFAVHLGILNDEFLTFITAHELGHYYWGLHVLAGRGYLDWLQLAMGIWADQLYLAELHGRSLPEQLRLGVRQGDWLVDYMEAVVRNREQRLGLSGAEQAAQTFDYNTLVRHGKAATGVYLQSLLLGPDRFLELQKRILEEYRHRRLEPETFVALLEGAGIEEAPDFFEAWMEGDATVDVTVASVAPREDGDGWQVALRRVGTVPYPVEVLVRSSTGDSVSHTMPATAGADTVSTDFVPSEVLLDPRGEIPMRNASHPEMGSVHARALDRAGLHEAFLALGRDLLRRNPDDDYLRYRVTRQLFWAGRWEEAAELAPDHDACRTRDRCLAALYAVRALARLGDPGAADRLAELDDGAERHDLGSLVETIRSELER